MLAETRARLLAVPLPLTGILLGALVVRVILVAQPLDVVVTKVMPDDSYYYLEVARNIVRGNGPSLDGLSPSNGFHPLWMALLLPLAPFSRDTLLYGALSLGVALDLAAIVALWCTAGALTKHAAIRFAAVAMYPFNPATAFASVNGIESPLSLLTLVLLFGLFLHSRDRRATDYRYWALLGVVSGLAVLARTDNGLFVAPVLLAVALRGVPHLRAAVLAGAVAVAVTLPWFAWNVAEFGTLLQGSAEATQLFAHDSFDPDGTASLGEEIAHGAGETKAVFLRSIPTWYFFQTPVLGIVVGALVWVVWLAALRSEEAGRVLRRGLPALAVPLIGFLALAVAHAGRRWHVRDWYLLSAVPLAALFLALALEAITTWLRHEPRLPTRLPYATLVPLLVLAVILGAQAKRGLDTWDTGKYYWQADILTTARWLRDETPPDTHLAGFNVGILAFASERRTTNLDGVINDAALRALRDRTLGAYIGQLDPDYIADYESYIFFYRRYSERRFVLLPNNSVPPVVSSHPLFGAYRVYFR